MGLDAQYRQLVRALARIALATGLVAALVAAAAGPAQACRLALVFALDVSASVDEAEYRLQLEGLTQALADPAVRTAMLAHGDAPGGTVALAAYEWSGARQQAMIAPWTAIRSEAGLDAFVGELAGHKRRYGEFPTAVGYALGYGAVLMRRAPVCARRVIDISGDGVNNDGFGPAAAYREFDFEGVTVNGLVIGGGNLELISFYQLEVAHGPDAFVEVAADFADYARAMRRKLLRELGGDHVARAAPDWLARSQVWIPLPARHP
ncbi:MAG TPA: DUF1194 domain-containing protein [Thermohalobaculum sp.]|nr:DUF1194 domain-containing protein [Thermohalobaculum sp.]